MVLIKKCAAIRCFSYWVSELKEREYPSASHSSLGSCLLAGCRRYHGAKLTEDFLFLLMVPEFIGWSHLDAFGCCVCKQSYHFYPFLIKSGAATALQSKHIHFRNHFLQILSEAPNCSSPKVPSSTTWSLLPTCVWATMWQALLRSQNVTGLWARCQKEAEYGSKMKKNEKDL